MIIGITGFSGSGKTTLSSQLEKILPKAKVIDVDKIHITLLIHNKKWLLDTYGENIFIDNKLNEELFMTYPEKVKTIFKLSNRELSKALKKEIEEKLKTYKYVILDSFALPRVKNIWQMCNYTILVKGINDIERYKKIKTRQEKINSKQPVDLNLRNSMSPNYNLYIYDYNIVNAYNDEFFQNIIELANDIKNI